MKRLVILGAGGMAREVVWTVREINRRQPRYEFLGYVVSDLARLGDRDSGAEVLGDYDWLQRNPADALAIGVGMPDTRLRIAAQMERLFPHADWPVLIHPTAICDAENCRFGRGVFVGAGAILTCNVVLADFALANFGCTVGHESQLGAGCVVNPGANISGGVTLGRGVLIGTGAQVLQYLSVGDEATVGAGAVVTRDIAAGETVVGVPARPLMRGPAAGPR